MSISFALPFFSFFAALPHHTHVFPLGTFWPVTALCLAIHISTHQVGNVFHRLLQTFCRHLSHHPGVKADIFHGNRKVCLVSKPSFNQVSSRTLALFHNPHYPFFPKTLVLSSSNCISSLTTRELCVSLPIFPPISKLNEANKNCSRSGHL